MVYHQGRLLDHIHLRVGDFERSCEFYTAILGALGREKSVASGRDWLECDELYIDEASSADRPSPVHLCFQADGRAAVALFYKTAMANGGRDNGAPGLRDYHPGYYAAYVLDPDGNNIEAKFDERVSTRSAPDIEIKTG